MYLKLYTPSIKRPNWKTAKLGLSISKCLVLNEVDLLTLEILEEAFGRGVVAEFAFNLGQVLDIGGAGVLNTAARLVNQSGLQLE